MAAHVTRHIVPSTHPSSRDTAVCPVPSQPLAAPFAYACAREPSVCAGWASGRMSQPTSVPSCHLSQLHEPLRPALWLLDPSSPEVFSTALHSLVRQASVAYQAPSGCQDGAGSPAAGDRGRAADRSLGESTRRKLERLGGQVMPVGVGCTLYVGRGGTPLKSHSGRQLKEHRAAGP